MKSFLLTCLMLVTCPAWAEWVVIATTERATFYFDPATIRKDGNMRTVWLLIDHNERDRIGSMSTRLRREIDCKKERERIISRSAHSGPMLTGELIISSSNIGEWDDIPPQTVVAKQLKTFCAK
jgi:hypothetical protein